MYDKDENGTIEQDEMVEVFKKIVKRKSRNSKINKHNPLLSKRSPWKKSPKTKKLRATFISDHRVFIFILGQTLNHIVTTE